MTIQTKTDTEMITRQKLYFQYNFPKSKIQPACATNSRSMSIKACDNHNPIGPIAAEKAPLTEQHYLKQQT